MTTATTGVTSERDTSKSETGSASLKLQMQRASAKTAVGIAFAIAVAGALGIGTGMQFAARSRIVHMPHGCDETLCDTYASYLGCGNPHCVTAFDCGC